MLTKLDREFIWGRTFMILGWNLMSRSNPRHVYCNPTKPEICPFLALGQYLCCLTEKYVITEDAEIYWLIYVADHTSEVKGEWRTVTQSEMMKQDHTVFVKEARHTVPPEPPLVRPLVRSV
ncbi:hypothetical protein GUITHDRAFT_74153 [Guillardia theta CCMP2712]|uniref:Uncharacterized protein n=1 Tax=Guillardia theta (strain CCMP2712) TaxID=905079 RepID=L1J278_GUITC|nr:hypothetical protein GUITHDRAFT_74153 [Guillardia theta CCMP2712]EKX42234.1 hypothetical protein GUITHDRAFT_74153 [Guillardia theta CCMP2712]|eukprot:XP_005829214.1 hypothetical protein GUITHDRAFT_74153 [Guillardia theta CCMP2712]